MSLIKVEISDAALKVAVEAGMDDFIHVFTNKYSEIMGGKLTADKMDMLSGEQHALLSYVIFQDEIMNGGFIQMIQNGYGGYIFDNPFAKAMRIFGVEELSKIIYKAKKIYDDNKADLEKETTEEEFVAMYEQYEAFDELEEAYFEIEESTTAKVAEYVDENIDKFATII